MCRSVFNVFFKVCRHMMNMCRLVFKTSAQCVDVLSRYVEYRSTCIKRMLTQLEKYIGEEGTYLASDAAALIAHTRRMLYLDIDLSSKHLLSTSTFFLCTSTYLQSFCLVRRRSFYTRRPVFNILLSPCPYSSF